jgi:2,4-dienoyl-CoA reductase-like NADH-dependent reductase (Old Yellow Enzyme family)
MPALFTPITVGQLTLRNRLWVSPMCQYSTTEPDGRVGPWHQAHYGALAAGGAGLVVVEATAVSPEGRITLNDLGLWEDSQVPGLRDLADFMHSQGVAAGIQLAHAGRKAGTTPMWDGSRPLTAEQGAFITLAPSPIAFGNYPLPRQANAGQIEALTAAWANAAKRAVEAGFDFIEIHGAHGYLLHQFMSPLSNTRVDGYGGTLAGRCRFALAVVKAVRQAIPDRVALSMRVSATDWADGGWGVDDTVQLAVWAREQGLDHIDVSSGGLVENAKVPVGPGYQAPFAAQVKKASGLSANAVGLIDSAAQAEQLVASGAVDAVMLGRPLLRDPHLPIAWATELGVEPTSVCPPQYARAQWRRYH